MIIKIIFWGIQGNTSSFLLLYQKLASLILSVPPQRLTTDLHFHVEKDSPTTRRRSRADPWQCTGRETRLEGLVWIVPFPEVWALSPESWVTEELMQGCDKPAKGSLGKHLVKGWLFNCTTGTGVDLPSCPLWTLLVPKGVSIPEC